MIQLKNLQKYYNKGRQNEIHVINDVTLELPDTGLVAVFGPSGCGKTTLLNVIGGLDSIASGDILLNDSAMSTKNDDYDVLRNRDIGIIFQNYNLNKKSTVFDNVADSLRLCGMTDDAVIAERVNAALTNVGMEKFSKRLPDTLSGGQQQRVAIARAIVKNPKVILADEPTGNLDEANTIMVMDILKAMSRERLVLLVTHEAELVDFYCDTVIELKDGSVVDVRNNHEAEGYVARSKNDIYLGELSEHELADGNTDLTFFGDTPEEPIKITVVNHNGRFFLKINTPKVTLLDENSEVNLKEGVYQEAAARRKQEESVDMSKLPPIEGKEYGKLFHFRQTLKSGYRDNFKSMMQRKSKKRLAFCLVLFGAAFACIAAMFGRGLGQVINAKQQYNGKIMYVAAMTDDVAPVLEELAKDPSSAIVYYGLGRVISDYPTDPSARFTFSRFVTSGYYDEGFQQESQVDIPLTFLPESLMGSAKVIAGTGTPLQDDQIIITKRVAKLLFRKTPYRYVNNYDMILGIYVNCPEAGQDNYLEVVGIVDSDELAAYVADTTLTLMQIKMRDYCPDVTYDKDGYFEVAQGECTIIIGGYWETSGSYDDIDAFDDIPGRYVQAYPYFDENDNPEEQGIIVDPDDPENAYPYDDPDNPEFYGDPDGSDGSSDETGKIIDGIYDGKMTVPELPKVGSTIYYNGIPLKVKEVKVLLKDNPNPTSDEVGTAINEVDSHLPDYLQTYFEPDNGQLKKYRFGYVGIHSLAFVLSKEDYINGGRVVGKTTKMMDPHMMRYSMIWGGGGNSSAETEPGIYDYSTSQSMFHFRENMPTLYYAIYSSNPAATSKKLEEAFRNLEAPGGYDFSDDKSFYRSFQAVYTKSDRFFGHVRSDWKEMAKLLIIGAGILLFLCLCMYFIMKSNIINRIREVGIYRAIGVTKKNMRFRFAVETGVVVACSVMVGFLFATIVIKYILHVSTLAGKLFYFPLWYAAIVLAFLFVVCIICGMIPLIRLLRRTPAEILAKYDI